MWLQKRLRSMLWKKGLEGGRATSGFIVKMKIEFHSGRHLWRNITHTRQMWLTGKTLQWGNETFTGMSSYIVRVAGRSAGSVSRADQILRTTMKLWTTNPGLVLFGLTISKLLPNHSSSYMIFKFMHDLYDPVNFLI